MMQVWDTSAIIEAMGDSSKRGFLVEAYLSGVMVITGPTLTELASWRSQNQTVAAFYDQLQRTGTLILPRRKDFVRAGKWLQDLPCTGTPSERARRRERLVMDSLIAATAWGHGFPVVTANVKDFAALQRQAEGMLGRGQTAEVITLRDALEG